MPIEKTAKNPSAPPRRGRPSNAARETLQQAQAETAQVLAWKEGLDGWMQFAAAGLIATKNYADAGAIGLHGEKLTLELAKMGPQNERLGKIFDYLCQIGPWSGVLSAALTLGMQFAVNHNRVPAESVQQFGVMPGDMLADQVRLEIATAQAKLTRELNEARAALAEEQRLLQAEQNGHRGGVVSGTVTH